MKFRLEIRHALVAVLAVTGFPLFAASDSRVAWHESKSAVIFRLSQEVDVSNNRRMIIRKHIVIEKREGTRPPAG